MSLISWKKIRKFYSSGVVCSFSSFKNDKNSDLEIILRIPYVIFYKWYRPMYATRALSFWYLLMIIFGRYFETVLHFCLLDRLTDYAFTGLKMMKELRPTGFRLILVLFNAALCPAYYFPIFSIFLNVTMFAKPGKPIHSVTS